MSTLYICYLIVFVVLVICAAVCLIGKEHYWPLADWEELYFYFLFSVILMLGGVILIVLDIVTRWIQAL